MQVTNPYELRSKYQDEVRNSLIVAGSIPYGLPCVALTRRTLDSQIKTKQIEMINEKICRIMRDPSSYVNISDSTTGNE